MSDREPVFVSVICKGQTDTNRNIATAMQRRLAWSMIFAGLADRS